MNGIERLMFGIHLESTCEANEYCSGFNGADLIEEIMNMNIPNGDWEACSDLCEKNSSCTHWEFFRGVNCRLLSGPFNPVYDEWCVSGYPGCTQGKYAPQFLSMLSFLLSKVSLINWVDCSQPS